MKQKKPSTSAPQPPEQPRPDISSVSEMLTPSELESLRRNAKESDAYFHKAFADLRPTIMDRD